MKSAQRFSQICILSLIIGACATVPPRVSHTIPQPRKSPPQKMTGSQPVPVQPTGDAPLKASLFEDHSASYAFEAWLRLSSQNGRITPHDEELFSQSEAPEWNTPNKDDPAPLILEAFRTMTVLRMSLRPSEPRPEGEDVELSLEALCNKHHINLSESFASNPLLNTAQSLALLKEALNQDPSSEGFRNEIQEVISRKVALLLEMTLPPQGGELTSGEITQDGATTLAAPLPFDQDGYASDEDRLQLAQEHITHSRFREAASLLREFPKGSLFYVTAQEKLKEAANFAVKNLRKEAAKAFQSALPVSDKKARAAYLEKAEDMLERALSDFPESDQLETVKRNLAAIRKNIQLINPQ